MLKSFVRTFAFAAGLAALSTTAVHASPQRVTRVNIPFQFQVDRTTMPPGEYILRKEFGREYAMFENAKTGDRAFVLCPSTLRNDGRPKITFIQEDDGLQLHIN